MLTPDNMHSHLYRIADFDRTYTDPAKMIALWDGAYIEPEWNVYLDAGYPAYIHKGRSFEYGKKFFLPIYPCEVSGLPEKRKQHGYVNLDFYFA